MAKEPWQMTVDYYNEHEHPSANKPIAEIREDLINEMRRRSKEEPDRLPNELRQNFRPEKYFAPWSESRLRDWHSSIIAGDVSHKKLVEKALKEGKPVPPNVLVEYPDLAKLREKPSGKGKAYTVEDYDKDMARSRKAYQEVLAKTGSHKEAFKAENEIATEAGRRYEAVNPIRIGGVVLARQSERGIAIDKSLLAKQVVAVDDPRWLKHPNRFDVRGIDTPVRPGVAYADKGARRLSRTKHGHTKATQANCLINYLLWHNL